MTDIFKNSLEKNYMKTVSIEHRKQFAQFFTPKPIVQFMNEWILGNKHLKNVLEPAMGLGIFSRELLLRKSDISIKSFEIDKTICDIAVKYFSKYKNVSINLQDYMYNDWKNKYDGIICNPPYFKFHDYDNKSILKEMETRLNCKLNGFTNLYTLFLLKSIHQLSPNGRLAYIVPSEFLNSDYGKLVKTYLVKTKTLKHIIVVNFEENVFDDALTTASIILCANDNKTDKVKFTEVKNINDLLRVKDLIYSYPSSKKEHLYSFSELDPSVKWKNYYQKQNSSDYKNLVPFTKYAKVMRGIATGANDYFAFNLSKARQYSINEKYLLPCMCKSMTVKHLFFMKSDFEKLKQQDKDIFLLNVSNSDDSNVVKYLKLGQKQGIDKRYLTASRNPWYSLENRPPAPIWVSVFNRSGLKFVRNEANISNLTTFHCIYPSRDTLFSQTDVDLLFAYLLTDTARKIFVDNSREYGNGLQKFEPNDINSGKMLDISLLNAKNKNNILRLYQEYKETQEQSFIDSINDILINNYKI
ncbi:MAG: N-6 DNA methylase [Endomicrobium sp.]|jgi:adenine-specific DNA-methyltransferase|nr:N-6 DNA methylase [Endomicrobium sp.]